MVLGTFEIATRTSGEIFGFDSALTIVGFLAMMDDLRHKGRKRIWTASAASGRQAEDLTHRYLRLVLFPWSFEFQDPHVG